MKFILLTILSTIIIFFVWNILKRLFFNKFYQFPSPKKSTQTPKEKLKSNLKWDAETVEYEELNEKANGQKD